MRIVPLLAALAFCNPALAGPNDSVRPYPAQQVSANTYVIHGPQGVPSKANQSFMNARVFSMSVEFMTDRSANFRPVADGQLISIGKLNVRVLHTPRHTPGSQCFLVNENLLSRDTLFIDSCGRVDLPGSNPEKMWWSLNHRLAAVDDDATLCPGHNYADRATDTMGRQRRTNPTMKFPLVESFVQAMRGF